MGIRLATEADLPDLMRLAKGFHFALRLKSLAAWEGSVDTWAGWFGLCIGGGDKLCVAAESGGKMVGFCTAALVPAFWNPAVVCACETAIWVDPASRKTGCGSQMIEAAAAWGKERGATILAVGRSYSMGSGSKPKDMDRLLVKLGFSPHEKIYSRRIQ